MLSHLRTTGPQSTGFGVLPGPSVTGAYVGETAHVQLSEPMSEICHSRRATNSPTVEPRRTPALPALERIPVPAIALADDGAVLFANMAFAEILGCSREAITSMSYEEVFYALPTEETLFGVARLRADTGDLQHLDGSTIFAKMSKMAVMRRAGPVAVASIDELMERLSRLAGL